MNRVLLGTTTWSPTTIGSSSVAANVRPGARFGVRPLHVRLADLRPVQEVEDVGAKTECDPLANRESLVQRRVHLPDPGSAQLIAAGIAPLAVAWSGESVGIVPERHALSVCRIQRLPRHEIGTLIGVDYIGQSRGTAAHRDVLRQAGARQADAA